MSKAVGKSTPKAKHPKPSNVFLVMRDLNPGETFLEPPPQFADQFWFARLKACRSFRRYGVLKDGVFNIYINQQQAEKNHLWRSVELERCKIAYRPRDKRILFELTERYRMHVKKPRFQEWVDSLRAHRLYALAKAKISKDSEKVPKLEPSPAMIIPCTVAPSPVDSTKPSGPLAPEPCFVSEKPKTAVLVQNVEKKAPIPVPVIIVASQSENILKKSSFPPKILGAVTITKPKQDAPPIPKSATPKKADTQQLKPADREKKAPMPVEIFTKEPELPLDMKALVPATVPMPPPISESPPPLLVKEAVQQETPGPSTHDQSSTPILPAIGSGQKEKEEPQEKSAASEESNDSLDLAYQPKKPFRTSLPAPMSPAPSLFKLLMAALGRDVMRMALPATVMEPLSTLQVLCEELENWDLINQALNQSDPLWRMMYMAAFATSRYGSTAKRANRKPFNPLLAETFEFVHPTGGWRFLAEQVSHHPPVSACYAEGKGWRFWQDCELVASLSATAVKATPIGLIYLKFDKLGETYVWNKVMSQVTGIFSGAYTIDHIGEMTITCKETKLKCKLNFKKMTAGRRGDVDGQIVDEKGKVLQRICANWTESFCVGQPNESQTTRLWQVAEMPAEHERYYGFTRFALALNEIRNDIHGMLPKTDSRFRPDQRALEMGKVGEAEKLKRDLEERQRARRKVMETQKSYHTPLWFRQTENKDDPAAGPRWEFNGKYWLAKKDQFKGIEFVELW